MSRARHAIASDTLRQVLAWPVARRRHFRRQRIVAAIPSDRGSSSGDGARHVFSDSFDNTKLRYQLEYVSPLVSSSGPVPSACRLRMLPAS